MDDTTLDKFCICINELGDAIDRLIQKTEHSIPEYVLKDSIFDIIFGEFCACSDETEQVLNDIIQKVIKLPTVDVVPVRHGRWRDTGSGQECSICKEIQYGYDTGRHYCPNCGADMQEKKEK